MSALLETVGLRKSFGSIKVADDISLTIKHREIHAVIGPNGAGKTTLVSLLSGQLRQDAGKVLFAGEDTVGLDMAQRVKIGLARSFQVPKLFPRLSALENVAIAVQGRSGSSFRFFGDATREDGLNRQAKKYMADVGFSGADDRLASDLSHGEQRQLEVAMALATEPKVLLLDEPLAGTGRAEAELVVEMIRKLGSRLAILLIEHDMAAVFSLADRISVLVYGRIIATGKPEDIRRDPAVRAAYLGTEETV